MRFYLFAVVLLLVLPAGREENQAWADPPPGAPSAASPAAPLPGLTLAELEAIALEENPTLRQAAARVEAARGKRLQAGLYPNPVIGYQGEEVGQSGKAGQQGGFIGQELVTAGKLGLDRAVAAHEVRQSEEDFQAQQHRVLNDVRTGYWEVLAAQRAVELTERLVKISEEGLKAAEQLLAAQEVSRVDVLEAHVEADTTRLKLQNARNRRQSAWRRLTAVLGRPNMPSEKLTGDLEEKAADLSWEGALERLLAESPELAAAQAGVGRARYAVARQCAQRVPNVALEAGVLHDNASGYDLARVQIALPLPLLNRNQGNIARAQAELVAAENEVRRVELELQERLAAAFQRYAEAQQQVEAYRASILPNAETSLDLLRGAYKQREIGYIAILTSQRTYFNAQLSFLEALRQLRTSRVAIDGFLLGGGLQGQPKPLGIAAE